MNRTSVLALAIAACAAAPALALTPEAVWAAWQAQGSAQGQTITAESTSRAGDTLVLNGVAAVIAPEGGEVTVRGEIGTILMREADGAVEITLADSWPVVIRGTGEGAGSATLRIAHPGMVMTAETDGAGIGYVYSAPALSVTLETFESDEPFEAAFALTLDGVEGSYAASGTGEIEIGTEFAARALTIAASARDPGGPGRFSLEMASADVSFSGGGLLVPGTGAPDDFARMLAAGMFVEGDYGFGATTFRLDAADENGAPVAVDAAFDGTSFGLGLDAAAISYSAAAEAIRVTVEGGDMPFPALTMTAAEIATGFVLPLAAGAEPVDAGLLLRVVDLVVPDEIWGLADPTG